MVWAPPDHPSARWEASVIQAGKANVRPAPHMHMHMDMYMCMCMCMCPACALHVHVHVHVHVRCVQAKVRLT